MARSSRQSHVIELSLFMNDGNTYMDVDEPAAAAAAPAASVTLLSSETHITGDVESRLSTSGSSCSPHMALFSTSLSPNLHEYRDFKYFVKTEQPPSCTYIKTATGFELSKVHFKAPATNAYYIHQLMSPKMGTNRV